MTAFSPPQPRPGASASPATSAGRPGLGDRPAGPSLSPSRAADFKTCPLLFRFRTIDKLPEQPSADQVRGTLVHAVLERLFDLPAAERTPESAVALVTPEWERLLANEPDLGTLFATPVPASPSSSDPLSRTSSAAVPGGGAAGEDAGVGHATELVRDPAAVAAEADAAGQIALVDAPAGAAEAARLAAFLTSARDLLGGYFAVEDPQRLEPAERETLISTMIDDELLIRGYIDRLDISPAGDLRVVDYKTGGAPREAFEGRALFQLKFYALVLWRTRGVVPRVLRLLYLKDAEVLDYSPDAGELERFERTLIALSNAVERAKRDQDFRPKPSRLCGWCSHQALCPEFGGTPPPFPTSPTAGLPTDSEPDRLATPVRDDAVA
ncbi:RecB family exonuclease [Actinoplanes sp. HUAS TT8]|uniref:RecB family exonuclease n=1 Tax=Actinoplanes sp. HUAS TT8 TaxID=3447453 RepID=UPI003F525372